MKKVKIYALINTKDQSVFYIGATVQQLSARLSTHVNTRLISKKSLFIYDIYVKGGAVEIFELDECDFEEGSRWEQFYIDLYRSFGFTLIQKYNSSYNERKPLNRLRGDRRLWHYGL